ncbi:Arc family DNA-binding protein [Agrobacterium tumefaciens]|uniref:Arc family DNA-binding protein n=1 Tax=Agrobacterium tumefaciens TaxID=358 RepID=UPI001572179F|nr:Arc family DNA-binding protein [Agrobacterium tumefaciens]NTE36670.1 Arc family DNA-binding protein [Agrobacterium tumefaciens]NTE52181.1 Arc family DNA-binding protein [Agrobacterium tumefaciens]
MTPIPPLGIRLPTEIKEKIKAAAAINRRSMNAEIVVALESIYANQRTETKKADALA